MPSLSALPDGSPAQDNDIIPATRSGTTYRVTAGSLRNKTVATSLSAAGTTQANATALAARINEVTTVTSGAGVRLPTAQAGMEVTVVNRGANPLIVYGAASGQGINDAGGIVQHQNVTVSSSTPVDLGGYGHTAAPWAPTREWAKNASVIDITAAPYSAVGNGSTDNQTAIQNAIDAAQSQGKPLYIPAGTFNHSGVLNVWSNVTVFGAGPASVLRATTPAASSVFLKEENAALYNFRITHANVTTRLHDGNTCGVFVETAATNFKIANMEIDNCASAGILVFGAKGGYILNNYVHDTKADSIHNTRGARRIHIAGNRTLNSGDDGIAVVSYGDDPGTTGDILAEYNTILNNVGGRGMTVVGGDNVTYRKNYINNSGSYAGILVGGESSYNSFGATDITIEDNIITNCGSTGTGHPCLFLTNTSAYDCTGIKFIRNRVGPYPHAGIKVEGALSKEALIAHNTIAGASNQVMVLAGVPAGTGGRHIIPPGGTATYYAVSGSRWYSRLSV